MIDIKKRKKSMMKTYRKWRRKAMKEGHSLRREVSADDMYEAYEEAKKMGVSLKNWYRDQVNSEKLGVYREYQQIKKKMKELDRSDEVQADLYDRYKGLTKEQFYGWTKADWYDWFSSLDDAGLDLDEYRGIYENRQG